MTPKEKQYMEELNAVRGMFGGFPLTRNQFKTFALNMKARSMAARIRLFKTWADMYREVGPKIVLMGSNIEEADVMFVQECGPAPASRYIEFIEHLCRNDEENGDA